MPKCQNQCFMKNSRMQTVKPLVVVLTFIIALFFTFLEKCNNVTHKIRRLSNCQSKRYCILASPSIIARDTQYF